MVPLSGGFMITGILGFIISAIYTSYGTISVTWGVSISLIFLIMFIASVLSITPSPEIT